MNVRLASVVLLVLALVIAACGAATPSASPRRPQPLGARRIAAGTPVTRPILESMTIEE